jgi:putative toxin-antitoxin system antitoxin component (TIGR02293 family)
MMDVPAIAHLLGGKRVLKKEPTTPADLVTLIGQGLPYASLEFVATRVGLDTQEKRSEVLGIPERTLVRRATSKSPLDSFESELTVRLARLVQRAEAVLEDPDKAYQWLREPNAALGGKRPLDLILTDIGTSMVEDVLTRIEYTVYG